MHFCVSYSCKMLSLSFLNEIHFNVDIFAFHIAAKCCHYEKYNKVILISYSNTQKGIE